MVLKKRPNPFLFKCLLGVKLLCCEIHHSRYCTVLFFHLVNVFFFPIKIYFVIIVKKNNIGVVVKCQHRIGADWSKPLLIITGVLQIRLCRLTLSPPSPTGKDEGEEQAGPAAAGDNQGVGDAGGREDQRRGAGVASDDGQEMGRLAQELHAGTARRHSGDHLHIFNPAAVGARRNNGGPGTPASIVVMSRRFARVSGGSLGKDGCAVYECIINRRTFPEQLSASAPSVFLPLWRSFFFSVILKIKS